MKLRDQIGPATVETRDVESGTADPSRLFPHPGYETRFTGEAWDGQVWCYASEEEAIREHELAVAQLSFWYGIVSG